MILLFIMLLIILPWLIGIPLGIIKYINDTFTQAKETRLYDFEAYNACLEEENKKALERDYLTALIANLEDLQRIAERGERDEKQLRKIISLDKQIHAAQQKLEKLG